MPAITCLVSLFRVIAHHGCALCLSVAQQTNTLTCTRYTWCVVCTFPGFYRAASTRTVSALSCFLILDTNELRGHRMGGRNTQIIANVYIPWQPNEFPNSSTCDTTYRVQKSALETRQERSTGRNQQNTTNNKKPSWNGAWYIWCNYAARRALEQWKNTTNL